MKRVLLVLAGVAGFSVPALAQQSVADFYKGKTIRIVVGIDVGSGYDVTARVLQRHWGKHIPGNPTVIVQNQPGAGSRTMVEPARRQRPVRRHRDRRAVQWPADRPAAAARRRTLRSQRRWCGSAAPTAKRR